jgi:outer membrane protein OmpA-like peptidoglycan-associated protein
VRRYRWTAALLLLSACSPTIEQRHFLISGPPERDFRIFDDGNLSAEEVRASEELDGIQSRIARGELPKIQFDFDSDAIRLESYRTLDLIADWFLRHPRRKVWITAHTCDIGTPEYNLILSKRRAQSVKGYLVAKGVPPPAIRWEGMGMTEPLVANTSEENREKNRRVEFRLILRDWSAVF